MTDVFEHRRADFAERVARLAGGTTYREPIGGYGSRSDYMPDDHAIASALAFARQGQHDIGPDIAVAIATGNPAHRMKIVTELSAALLIVGRRVADRCADDLLEVSAHCYLCVIGLAAGERPAEIRPGDYAMLRALGESILWESAERAFRRARRAYKAAA
jgi:hypothetical protein